MTFSHRFSGIRYLPVAALISLAGCASTQSAAFRTSFLPPAAASTRAHEEVLIPEPPDAPIELYANSTPKLLSAELTPIRSAEAENRLRRADEAYSNGQKAYSQGRFDDARREFNRAIDTLLNTPDSVMDRQRLDKRLDQLVEAIYRYDVNALGAGEDPDKVVYDRAPIDDGLLNMTFPIDPRLKSKVKEEIAATSSQLPLEENDSVLSYIHYFTTDRGYKTLTYGLKRSGRYRPMIQKVLAEEGLPQELIYLAQLESGFSPRAASYKKCVGLWQFQGWRGKQYGLDQSRTIDERMDPEKATRAAAKHLHDLYNQFGDWYLAMAAYNCGPGCVDHAVQRTGYADFWKLRSVGALPIETTNYVPAIVAMTIMAKNPKDYGLEGLELEPAIEYESVRLDAPVNLGLIADSAERPITEIKDLNPSLLGGVAPQGYEMRVPKGTATAVTAALEMVPASKRANWRIHKVEAGETLAVISKRFSTPAHAIVAANNTVEAPSAGDVLLIPASYQEPASTPHIATRKSRTAVRGSKRPVIAHSGKVTATRTAAAKASSSKGHRATYAKRTPSKILNRKATVKTASLR